MGVDKKKSAGEPVRLWCKGAILGYKRAKKNQTNNTSLIKIDGVNERSAVDFYLGKRCARARAPCRGPLRRRACARGRRGRADVRFPRAVARACRR